MAGLRIPSGPWIPWVSARGVGHRGSPGAPATGRSPVSGGTEGMPSSLPPNASRERVRLCPGLPPPDARGDCDSGLLTGNASSAAAARLEGPGPAALGSTTGSLGEGEPGLDLDFSETPVSLLNQPIEPRRSGEPTTQFSDGSVPFVRGARTRCVPLLSRDADARRSCASDASCRRREASSPRSRAAPGRCDEEEFGGR